MHEDEPQEKHLHGYSFIENEMPGVYARDLISSTNDDK